MKPIDMKRLLLCMALLLSFLFPGFPQSAQAAALPEDKAGAVIKRFQSVLLSTMKDATSLQFKGRYARLEPAVKRSHALSRIARLISGKHWRLFDKKQKARFTDTFTRLVISTYAHQFKAYSGESFNIETAQRLKRGRMLIRSVLVKANGKRVNLDYVLQPGSEKWLIINIIADGVSDLALKRSEYSAVLERDGFDVLLAGMERKIRQYE